MKKYKGIEIDENMNIIGYAQFVVFGEMSDGSKCYHKVVNGEEVEDLWYSRSKVGEYTVFIVEGR